MPFFSGLKNQAQGKSVSGGPPIFETRKVKIYLYFLFLSSALLIVL